MTTEDEHKTWLTSSREMMKKLVDSTHGRDKSFNLTMTVYLGSTVGMAISYRDSRDLTASVLEWWLDHQSGETPRFFLQDAVDKLGALWDKDVENMVWKHLEPLQSTPSHDEDLP